MSSLTLSTDFTHLGLVSWDIIQIFVALGMGFRPDPESDMATQVDIYTPPTWKKLEGLPNILYDEQILRKMEKDLPKSDDPNDDPMGK